MNQFNLNVKIVRTDNDGEFCGLECQNLFKDHGIVHQRTCPYTPQQNGVVERKHRHITQIARSLLHPAHLPQKFWGEAVRTATHLINRLPTTVLDWQCPYQVLTSTTPDYFSLKVFGCLCYATNLDPHKKKFDDRAKKCIFLGNIPNCKGYKIYELATQKIITSRDVIFYEHISPYKSIVSDDNTVVPLPIVHDDFHLPKNTAHTDHIVPETNCMHDIPLIDPDEHDDTPMIDAKITIPTPRKSTRPRQPPAWLQDYVSCTIAKPTAHTPNAIPYVTTTSYSPSSADSLCAMSLIKEPHDFTKAQASVEWQNAMQQEIHALEANNT